MFNKYLVTIPGQTFIESAYSIEQLENKYPDFIRIRLI
jgi:hypothetical protein